MIDRIAEHIHEMLPVYIVSMFVAGLGVFGAGLVAWYDLNRDMDLLKCKVGIDDNELCRWTSTIVEDLRKEEAPETN